MALSHAYPRTAIVCGSFGSAARFRLNILRTSVRLPADTSTESKRTGKGPPAVSTRNPIQEMALGSVACTRTLSLTSTRRPSESVTEGGVTSLAAERTVTVTVPLVPRRPAESSANPCTLNDPVVARAVSVSVNVTESTSGAVNDDESKGGVVGFVTAPAGDVTKTILRMPEFCTATTCTWMLRPVDATAPGVGAISHTLTARPLARKLNSVSSAKFPAPSIARPTILTLPPAPELAGKVMVF